MMVDITKAFDLGQNGLMFSLPNGDIAWIGAGSIDPAIAGISAPLGSLFFRTTGDQYRKTGPADTDWQISGLGDAVATQNADFGKTGNLASGAFLNRSGNVPSNIAGVPVTLSLAKINVVAAAVGVSGTFTLEIYEHDGNFTNPVLKHTISINNDISAFDAGLNIPVTQGKQLAVMTLDGIKNAGVTVGMKGLAL